MNGNGEAARAWLQKAESDIDAAEICLAAGKALDAACFHSQQAAEKSLKAWLIAREMEFPFVHDLGRLVTLCAKVDPEFEQVREAASGLTPFAVEMRYDAEFWPTGRHPGSLAGGTSNSSHGRGTLVRIRCSLRSRDIGK